MVVMPGGLVQLGQPDQVPAELIGLAGCDEGRVLTSQRLVQQRQPRVGVGLRQDAFGQCQIARLAGDQIEIGGRIQQYRGGHAVVVAQRGDVDARLQGLPAQVGDPARGLQVGCVAERAPRFQEPKDQIAVRPDVPGAQRRLAVPALRLGRLRHGEATLRRIVAQVAVIVLLADQPVGDAAQRGLELRLPALRHRARRGREPLACVLAIPVALVVLVLVRLAEDADRRAVLIHDERAQAPAAVGCQGIAQHALQGDLLRRDQRHAAGGGMQTVHAASTTQRKPTVPARSLDGPISRYLPC